MEISRLDSGGWRCRKVGLGWIGMACGLSREEKDWNTDQNGLDGEGMGLVEEEELDTEKGRIGAKGLDRPDRMKGANWMVQVR